MTRKPRAPGPRPNLAAARASLIPTHWRLLALLYVGILMLLAAPPARAQATAEPQNVIIIVIDGARYTETFGDPLHRYIPHIWYRLRPLGTIHTNLYNRGQTITLGALSTVLTGNRTWIRWPHEGDLSRPTAPTLFELFRAATGADPSQAWLIANHVPSLEGLTYSTHPDYGSPYGATWYLGPGSDRKLWGKVSAIMDQHQPRLILIDLHEADKYGHEGNWGKYTRHLMVADRIAYEAWQKIQRHPFYSNRTTLIITSDHGRHTRNFAHHGDCCEGCQHITFLALGPNIRRNYQAGDIERGLQDIGPTAALLMGIPMPDAVDGVVMTDILTPAPDPAPPAGSAIEGLGLSVITTDLDSVPLSVFSPGDTVGVEVTIHNQTAGQVCLYQSDLTVDTCRIGKGFGSEPVCLPPDEYYTDVEDVFIPKIAPPGQWPITIEYRSVDDAGNMVVGAVSTTITITSP